MRTLKRHVPSAVPGIAFLSGGQSPTEATAASEFDECGRTAAVGAHVQLRTRAAGYCAARLGRQPGGLLDGGQKALFNRAKLNGLAAGGVYKASMESSAA